MPYTRKTTKPAATQAKTTESEAALPRISVGTAFDTKNPAFFSGRPQEADARYSNQSELLKLLPAAPEGFHWSLKVFARETRNGRTLLDVILQQEEDYQAQA